METGSAIQLAQLSGDDLAALRLSAQVMAHRAELAGRPRVTLYFESLEAAVMAEQAGRGQAGASSDAAAPAPLLLTSIGADDSALLADCFSLLVGNERLSEAVRAYCAGLANFGVSSGHVSQHRSTQGP